MLDPEFEILTPPMVTPEPAPLMEITANCCDVSVTLADDVITPAPVAGVPTIVMLFSL